MKHINKVKGNKQRKPLTNQEIDGIVLEMRIIIKGYPDIFEDDLDRLQHLINIQLQEKHHGS